ncbi:MAG: EAL domain-containing protein [Burkholderiales bacterium]|nr:EAL domain-containing protein [Burkholderiales bacterium]
MKARKKESKCIEILIAEDSPTQAEQLRFLLEEHGYGVVTAGNGKEALMAAVAHKPTLVISDIVMPEMNGYELCKAIKSHEKLKDVPVILVTTLSDPSDVISGLACGADNFIRKPYEVRYLLSRIEYLLMNIELRKNQKMQMGVEIDLGGQKHFITSERQQILDLLISTYEQAVQVNNELQLREKELAHSNQVLNGLYRIADGLNQVSTEHQVAETALDRALELPGIQAGWIFLREGKSGCKLAAARNLPPALEQKDAFDGECLCRRKLAAGDLDSATNILECERLATATGDTSGLRCHASVPLWIGDRMLGLMNLVGTGQGLFDEEELKVLYGVGNQVAVALERARLYERMERLVEERTAILAAEVAQRKHIQEEQARLVAIIEATPDFIATSDLKGHVRYINQAGLRLLGFRPNQDLSALRIDAGYAQWALKRVREQGIPYALKYGVWSGETAFAQSDGREIPLSQVIIAHRGAGGAAEYLSTIARDITPSKRAEEALRASEARLRTIIEADPECVKIVNADRRLVQMNAAGLAMIEADSLDKVQGSLTEELVVPAQRESYRVFVDSILSGNRGAIEFEIIGLKGGRRWLDIHAVPLPSQNGGRSQMLAIARDVTLRKEQEARIVRLNRIYSVLSGINTTIVRVREPQELFETACRIAVEHGGFTFAWIGMLDAETRKLVPLARAGCDDGYLSQINLSAVEDDPGNCRLTAEAIIQVKPVICNDIATDERMAAWRDEALSRGYRSAVLFPLILEGRAIGVFVLYAPEANVFDDEEMALLTEMAGDISFALDHLKKEERLNYLAYFDAITDLPNRALFLDRVEQRISSAHRDQAVFSVIMLDLERFGSINESLGRQAGDSLLRQLAQRLKQGLSKTDILARLSADYFGIATRHDDKSTNIAYVLEKILSEIQNQPFLIDGQELRISARAGVSCYPTDGQDTETLLRNAEAALKKTKLSGDKYLFYTPEFNARVAETLKLENKLRRALEQEQLVLHYQPKIELKSGQISGLEALIRWNDPETGLVPPLKFIPLLEETGMILDAGRWALAKAVSDSRTWQANGLQSPRIAVNVSPIQLRQKDFVSMVARVINGGENAAVKLELEITESLIMQDIGANIQKLRGIREMGIEVAIDDFGTGYSSLSYIAKLPVNVLKIDRAFIINMVNNADDLSIVSTIISLAHSLNLRVIAEGVETEEQANLLRLLKCNEIQGYLFSPAVPAEEIEVFLREKKALGKQPG